MLVVRRLVALSALLAPILAPAWVGSRDAIREAEPETTTIVTRTAIVDEPSDEPVALWSPGQGAHTDFARRARRASCCCRSTTART